MDIELLFDAHAIIGEQPTWVEDERAIYMMDVRTKQLRRLTLDGEEAGLWILPDKIGAFALGPRGSSFAVVALRTVLSSLNLASGASALLEPAPFDPDEMRFNEGVLDPEGRLFNRRHVRPPFRARASPPNRIASKLHPRWRDPARARPFRPPH
jgi:sugar lactone lactonase YvrE